MESVGAALRCDSHVEPSVVGRDVGRENAAYASTRWRRHREFGPDIRIRRALGFVGGSADGNRILIAGRKAHGRSEPVARGKEQQGPFAAARAGRVLEGELDIGTERARPRARKNLRYPGSVADRVRHMLGRRQVVRVKHLDRKDSAERRGARGATFCSGCGNHACAGCSVDVVAGHLVERHPEQLGPWIEMIGVVRVEKKVAAMLVRRARGRVLPYPRFEIGMLDVHAVVENGDDHRFLPRVIFQASRMSTSSFFNAPPVPLLSRCHSSARIAGTASRLN